MESKKARNKKVIRDENVNFVDYKKDESNPNLKNVSSVSNKKLFSMNNFASYFNKKNTFLESLKSGISSSSNITKFKTLKKVNDDVIKEEDDMEENVSIRKNLKQKETKNDISPNFLNKLEVPIQKDYKIKKSDSISKAQRKTKSGKIPVIKTAKVKVIKLKPIVQNINNINIHYNDVNSNNNNHFENNTSNLNRNSDSLGSNLILNFNKNKNNMEAINKAPFNIRSILLNNTNNLNKESDSIVINNLKENDNIHNNYNTNTLSIMKKINKGNKSTIEKDENNNTIKKLEFQKVNENIYDNEQSLRSSKISKLYEKNQNREIEKIQSTVKIDTDSNMEKLKAFKILSAVNDNIEKEEGYQLKKNKKVENISEKHSEIEDELNESFQKKKIDYDLRSFTDLRVFLVENKVKQDKLLDSCIDNLSINSMVQKTQIYYNKTLLKENYHENIDIVTLKGVDEKKINKSSSSSSSDSNSDSSSNSGSSSSSSSNSNSSKSSNSNKSSNKSRNKSSSSSESCSDSEKSNSDKIKPNNKDLENKEKDNNINETKKDTILPKESESKSKIEKSGEKSIFRKFCCF